MNEIHLLLSPMRPSTRGCLRWIVLGVIQRPFYSLSLSLSPLSRFFTLRVIPWRLEALEHRHRIAWLWELTHSYMYIVFFFVLCFKICVEWRFRNSHSNRKHIINPTVHARYCTTGSIEVENQTKEETKEEEKKRKSVCFFFFFSLTLLGLLFSRVWGTTLFSIAHTIFSFSHYTFFFLSLLLLLLLRKSWSYTQSGKKESCGIFAIRQLLTMNVRVLWELWYGNYWLLLEMNWIVLTVKRKKKRGRDQQVCEHANEQLSRGIFFMCKLRTSCVCAHPT